MKSYYYFYFDYYIKIIQLKYNIFNNKEDSVSNNFEKINGNISNTKNKFIKDHRFFQALITIYFLLIHLIIDLKNNSIYTFNKEFDISIRNIFLNQENQYIYKNIEELNTYFIQNLENIINMRNKFFHKIINSNYNLELETICLNYNKYVYRLNSDIQYYNKDNIEKVINLPFSINNITQFKEFIDNTKYFELKVTDIIAIINEVDIKFDLLFKYYNKENYFESELYIDNFYMDNTNYAQSSLFFVIPSLILLCISFYFLFNYFIIFTITKKIINESSFINIIINNEISSNSLRNNINIGISWQIIILIRNITILINLVVIVLFEEIAINNNYIIYYNTNIVLESIFIWISGIELIISASNIGILFSIINKFFFEFVKIFSSFLPIFGCFILIGTILFSESDMFDSFTKTFSTLFAFLIGDSVLPIFNSLNYKGIIGIIYLLLYTIIFCFAFQSVITAYICDIFVENIELLTNKKKQNKSVILDTIKIDKALIEGDIILEKQQIRNKKELLLYKELMTVLFDYNKHIHKKNKITKLIKYHMLYIEFFIKKIKNKIEKKKLLID